MKTITIAARAASVLVCLFVFSGSAAAQVSAPWASADVGSPSLTGSARASGSGFVIEAAGWDIWGQSDQFHFVYQRISGDVDIRARVDSLTNTDAWAKAGVMVRNSLSADSAHGFMLVSAGRGMAFQRRTTAGALSTHTAGPSVTAPAWVRIVRSGTTVRAYSSSDGASWNQVGSDTIQLGSTIYVGLAATSHHTGMRTTATFGTASLTAAGVSGLPSGQTNRDIGSPAITGSVSHTSGTYTVRAGGSDIWGTSDQFHYVYQPVTGDVDVVARVRSLAAAHQWSKAGVMIRETTNANSVHATALVSGSKGYAFQRRAQTGSMSDHTSGGSGTAPGWVRLVRKGSTFQAFRSSDGSNWVSMGSATIHMADSVLVGLAVTSHNTNTAATAEFDNLRITETTTTTNRPPSVVISAPASGTSYTAPASFTISATASDTDGTVTGVDFYVNGTLAGRDTSAPYSVGVSSLAQGTYSLTAVATDDDGATGMSGAVSVTVAAATSTAPTAVGFTASTDHSTLVTRYVLEIYNSGTTPGSSAAVATLDLGKPTPSNGEIVVDCSSLFNGLATGSYLATVSAQGSGGSTRSTAVSFTR